MWGNEVAALRRWTIPTLASLLLSLLTLSLGSLTTPAHALVDDLNPAAGWRPSGGTTYAMARVGNMILLGGTFTGMRSPSGTTVGRSHLAAIDATTGDLLPWAPSPNGDVRAITASSDGSTVYLGGQFTAIAGVARTNLAAVSATTGQATSFVANTNALVRSLLVYDNSLFAVGDFWRVNNVSRGMGAELNLVTGVLKAWNPRANNGIAALAPSPDGTTMFIGGPFTQVAATARSYLAQVDRTLGSVTAWTSGSTCQDSVNPCVVYALVATPTTLYVGQGGPGGRVVDLDIQTGRQRWWAGSDGDFQSLVLDGTKIYAGGHFATAVSGVPRAGLVALDATSGAVLPDVSTLILGGSGVWQVMKDGSQLRVAGQFTTVGSASIGKYTSFTLLADPPDTTPPTVPSSFRVPTALSDSVSMSWAASTDNVATTSYRIFRDGTQIATWPNTNYKDRTVSPATTYTYSVAAVDAAGHASAASKPVTVTTDPSATRLLDRGAQWAYYSTGSAPGADWTKPGISEASWARGTGEFGFGDGDEDTFISPRGVAHYFRTTFNIDDVSRIQSAKLRLLVDDGAVIYLNGTELTRLNMPAGTIASDSLAVASISGTAEMLYTPVNIPVSALQTGSNVLAIEVHNVNAQSSDISFDAFVEGSVNALPTAPQAPTGISGTPQPDRVSLSWKPSATADSYTVYRDGAQVGSSTATTFADAGLQPDTAYTYEVTASNAVGTSAKSDRLTVKTDPLPPAAPDAPTGLRVTGTTSGQVTLQWDPVATASSYVVSRDGTPLSPVNGNAYTDGGLAPNTTYHYVVVARNSGGSSGPSDSTSATTTGAPIADYIVSGATWRVLDGGASAPIDWTAEAFDDSAWRAGKSQLGYGEGDEVTVLSWGSVASAKPITYYARTSFDAGSSVSDVTGLALRALVDDGAVVYLNGQEIWRYNLPAGPVTAATRASRYIAGAEENKWLSINLPSGALHNGTNVVTVEVHNDAPSSSDISLDLELRPVR